MLKKEQEDPFSANGNYGPDVGEGAYSRLKTQVAKNQG
jgi:hypothetical protein